jgi:hypothetical protein
MNFAVLKVNMPKYDSPTKMAAQEPDSFHRILGILNNGENVYSSH